MARITEEIQIAGMEPRDLAAAAQSGDWVGLKEYDHLAVVVIKAAGAAAENATLTVEQATSNAGAGAKALNFTRVDRKEAADIETVGEFTKVTQAAANTFTLDGDSEGIYVVEFDGQDLDIAGGFAYVRATFGDVGVTAQLAAVVYLLSGARYAEQFPPSAID